MFLSRRSTRLVLSAFALGIFAVTVNLGAGGQGPFPGDGHELSGPPTMNLTYQARNPRLCKPVSAPPMPGQVRALIQCTMDQDRATGLFLMQDVHAEISQPRAYNGDTDSSLPEIDMNAPIFPLAGSLKVFWCSPIGVGYPAGRNCQLMPTPSAMGSCWRTTFGDWKCNLIGPAPDSRKNLPGPTDY
jgi:hypothetical protein